ncbi:hypothetical protein QC762_702820 [Podospora pseudocomata]|uniref:Erythromycin esterase n=1 Tax=Podospora pseudocomata TaxID=2093779 RepID=A0ABR0G2U2_9PEZI|nr:hypothetical protein QC762_702820 [Podospora pseudocomata]
MARRSARLASAQRAMKPSHEEPVLAAVAERDDTPAESAAVQNIDAVVASPAPGPGPTPTKLPATPAGKVSRIKPPATEMHPAKYHPTMAPPSSGLRLGFTDIVKPTSSRSDALPGAIQSTPTKIAVPSSSFTFRQSGHLDKKLGPEAQRMMDQIRDQAAKIKVELVAQREAEKAEEEQINNRKIATAKGKAGRFSSAHMNEFKKMDSIANHPSAFRAQSSRITPLKQGVKRSQSKANLDEPEHARSKQSTPVSTIPKANQRVDEVESPIKRARQHIEDDATTKRPISRDASAIPMPKSSSNMALPRSKSNLASLMTPTKSSLARSSSTIAKTPVRGSLLRSPSKPALGGLIKSATTSNIAAVTAVEKETTKTVEVKSSKAVLFTTDDLKSPKAGVSTAEPKSPEVAVEVKTPKSRFEQVKSLFRRSQASAAKPKSTIPMPSTLGSKTPAPPRLEKELPPVPMTTPARKLTKRVAFTPDTQHAAMAQNSPSPVKSGVPVPAVRQPLGEVHYPSLDGVLAEQSAEDVSYPDLSTVRPLPDAPTETKAPSAEPSVPGTFSFRGDHTISFGGPSSSFGFSPGQASIRPVRPSILPTENMPGSFPRTSSSTTVSDKENEAPRTVFAALPHGMTNKKRHRVTSDEEEEEAEREAADRAAKKRKQVPEGDALLAPRLVAASAKKTGMQNASPRKMAALPGRAPGTPSPMKKKTTGGGISLSRLQALSRPKVRK